jgi:hypothetical protein
MQICTLRGIRAYRSIPSRLLEIQRRQTQQLAKQLQAGHRGNWHYIGNQVPEVIKEYEKAKAALFQYRSQLIIQKQLTIIDTELKKL